MAYNQFKRKAQLDGTTLFVEGTTKTDPPGQVDQVAVAVGTFDENGGVPDESEGLLHDILGARRLDSPWTAQFANVPAGYARGEKILVIGVATGDFPGGPTEIWYERVEIV